MDSIHPGVATERDRVHSSYILLLLLKTICNPCYEIVEPKHYSHKTTYYIHQLTIAYNHEMEAMNF